MKKSKRNPAIPAATNEKDPEIFTGGFTKAYESLTYIGNAVVAKNKDCPVLGNNCGTGVNCGKCNL